MFIIHHKIYKNKYTVNKKLILTSTFGLETKKMSANKIMDFVNEFLRNSLDESQFTDISSEWNTKTNKAAINKILKNIDSKDSEKPKRPKSAYMFYCSDKREEIKKKLGSDAKPKDILSELGKSWQELQRIAKEDDSILSTYKDSSEKDKERYILEMEKYNDTTIKKSSKHKKPKSSYIYFCNEYRASIQSKDLKPQEVTKELGVMWAKLKSENNEEYKKFVQMAIDDKERYNNEKDKNNSESNSETKPVSKNSDKRTNGYTNYSKSQRPTLKEENPGKKAADITKLLAKNWNALSEEEKLAWNN